MFFLKILFVIGLILTFVGGIIGILRFDKWFGHDPNVPSDNESVSVLNKSQFIMVWLLTLLLFGLMAIML